VSNTVRIILDLTPEQAAGLKRFADKVSYEDAQGVLYPHVSKQIRDEQAYQIIAAFSEITVKLIRANVRDFHWKETGRVEVKP
jgi:hypothetical protein